MQCQQGRRSINRNNNKSNSKTATEMNEGILLLNEQWKIKQKPKYILEDVRYCWSPVFILLPANNGFVPVRCVYCLLIVHASNQRCLFFTFIFSQTTIWYATATPRSALISQPPNNKRILCQYCCFLSLALPHHTPHSLILLTHDSELLTVI